MRVGATESKQIECAEQLLAHDTLLRSSCADAAYLNLRTIRGGRGPTCPTHWLVSTSGHWMLNRTKALKANQPLTSPAILAFDSFSPSDGVRATAPG